MNEQHLMKNVAQTFPDVLFGKFSAGNVSAICSIQFPLNIIHLDLPFNSIKHLRSFCSSSLFYVKAIVLDHNIITKVESFAFFKLTNLKFISLPHNFTESLPFHFVMIPHMKVLSVKSMKFPQIKTNAKEKMLILFMLQTIT